MMGPQERAEQPESSAWSLEATFPLFLDAKNYVWRDNGDGTSSMARTNPDNSPIPEPRTYLIPAPSRDAAEAWHSLAALSEEVERYRGVLECGHAKQFGAIRPGGWTCRVCQLHEAEAQRDELVKVARALKDLDEGEVLGHGWFMGWIDDLGDKDDPEAYIKIWRCTATGIKPVACPKCDLVEALSRAFASLSPATAALLEGE